MTTAWTTMTTAERQEAVRDYIVVRKLSYGLTAQRLGTTRNAIAGMVNRLRKKGEPTVVAPPSKRRTIARKTPAPKNWSVRPERTAPPMPRKPKPRSKPTGVRPGYNFAPNFAPSTSAIANWSPPQEAFSPLPGTTPALLEHRTGCTWPVGEGPTLYCNAPLKPGKSWCPEHCAIGFVPAPPDRTDVRRAKLRPMISAVDAGWDR